MPLPDPETIVVPEADVLEQIPDDNPFKETIVDLRDDGDDWGAIEKALRAVYNPIDKAAFDESFVELPEFEIRVVVHDEQSTSGERYKTITHADETEDAAIAWAEERHDVLRVESTEKVGTVTVG